MGFFFRLQLIMEPSKQTSPPDSISQDVNPVFFQQLRDLDIPEEAAKQVQQDTYLLHIFCAGLLS